MSRFSMRRERGMTALALTDRDLAVMLGPASTVRAMSAGRPDVAEQLLAPCRDLAGERLRPPTVAAARIKI
ncbi:hypothetical protein [Streptomyces fagopyri]|uniref:hypothetical protein n=1 Tax=Streptomyces fagopyri TaxID=2662397 RepID=UPI0037123655